MRSTVDRGPGLLTVADLERLFGTSYSATLRRIRNELIPFSAVIKLSNRYHIQNAAFQEYLDSKTVHGDPKARTDSMLDATRGKDLWKTVQVRRRQIQRRGDGV